MKFGTDGVRGAAHTELTTDFARRLACAAAVELTSPSGRVVLGGDTRESTPAFVAALSAGFRSEGVDVIDIGVVPTPVVAFEAQRRDAIGAMVSASHNPWHDNGIKLFAAGGTKLSDEVQHRIEARLEGDTDPRPAGSDPDDPPDDSRPDDPSGRHETDHGHGAYVAHALSILQGRQLDGLSVVLDCAHGAGSVVGPQVLRAAGADVHVIADAPNGRNINDAVGATSTDALVAAVADAEADVGLALDGDADRLIAVDHLGRLVDGDHLIAICAADLRRRRLLRRDTVVVTVMSNLGFRLAMEEAGVHVVETAVGDRYVLEALAAGNYSLGGEQSGHVIFAEHATTGDGVLTALALLDVLARTDDPLSEIAAAAMTSFPQKLVNVRVAERVPDVADRLAPQIAAVEESLGRRGRVLVRPSGTEPLIRVMVEAETDDAADHAAALLVDAVRREFA